MSKKTINIFRPLGAVMAVFMFLGWIGPAWPAEDPTISLVKTIIVREYNGRKINAEEYVVERGEYLSRILARRKNIKSGRIPWKTMRMLQALNPELTNPDFIKVGQKLILPAGQVKDLKVAIPGWAARSAKKAKYRVHTVREGERLCMLLRRHGLPNRLIFNKYIFLTMALNPQLQDPDLIYTDQKIKVPLPLTWSESAVAGLGAKRPQRLRPSAPPTTTRTARQPRSKLKVKKPPRLRASLPQLPPSKLLATRTALGLIFARIGERFISKGQLFLPLRSGGRITINAKSFPIIEMRTGRRIILDIEQRLPDRVIGLIRTNWSNYMVFRPKPGEKLPSLLERLLELGQYYKVRSKGTPCLLGGQVKVKVRADWIIWPTAQDWSSGRAVVITLPGDTWRGTVPEVAAYLSRRGLKVIDFYPQGSLIGPEPRRGPRPKKLEVGDLTSNTHEEFIHTLLALVGQRFESDLAIPLGRKTGKNKELKSTIRAPIYFTRHGVNYVVDVRGLSAKTHQLLKNHKFEVIKHGPDEDAQALALKLLKAMRLKTELGLTIKASSRPSDRNIEVTLPGVLIHSAGRRLLLTPRAIPSELAPLLAQPKLQVFKYRVLNPS